MDAGFSRAVVKVFVELHRQGLLYRDKRLVNWDPYFKTAISDLEVEQKEVQGHFWHFRYPLEDGSGFIPIATTRPETILGDGAVAVNPADERYAHLVGTRCRLPIVDRLIPIIADEHVKMDFGSGAVKITAAHDWNDYEVARRHPEANIPLINLLNADATMSDACPPDYRGLDRYDARRKVVADFEALGLLDKIEPHTHMVPFGDRSGVVIEPWLTDQWYVDAKTLAGPALDAVRSGAIRVVPETWKKTWYQWLENIQPWCVSRQLWWGHQIPAWYGPSEHPDLGWQIVHDQTRGVEVPTFVALTLDEARAQAAAHYEVPLDKVVEVANSIEAVGYISPVDGEAPAFLISEAPADRSRLPIWRDNDVLDTWFSSALWPFGTLGWPEDEAAPPSPFAPSEVEGSRVKGASLLARHYPNDVLVSRVRHPVLLGCADGDAGAAFHGGGAVEDIVPPRAGAPRPMARRCPSRRAIRSIRWG